MHSAPHAIACPDCDGSSRRVSAEDLDLFGADGAGRSVECSSCDGRGTLRCAACGGQATRLDSLAGEACCEACWALDAHGPAVADTALTCSCGRAYTAEQWRALPFVGEQQIAADAFGPAVRLEFRNCACGSTRVLETEVA